MTTSKKSTKSKSKKTSKKASLKQSRTTGSKTLPPLGDAIHLSNFGYSLKNSKQSRQKSLKKASKKHSTLKILKRTNLIANYSQSNEENYKKLREDVEFLKKEYEKEKDKKN